MLLSAFSVNLGYSSVSLKRGSVLKGSMHPQRTYLNDNVEHVTSVSLFDNDVSFLESDGFQSVCDNKTFILLQGSYKDVRTVEEPARLCLPRIGTLSRNSS